MGQKADKADTDFISICKNQLLELIASVDVVTESDRIRYIRELIEREERQDAKKLFYEAMAKLQANIGEIKENGVVDYINNKKQLVYYNYAKLEDISVELRKHAPVNGFSYSFDHCIDYDNDSQIVNVTCNVYHVGGYETDTSLSIPIERSMSGANNSQQIKATITYLKRITLSSAFGLSTGEKDFDGMAQPPGAESQNEDQSDDFYSQALFDENIVAWKEQIEAGLNPEDLLNFLSSKDINLSDTQVSIIRSIEKDNQGA